MPRITRQAGVKGSRTFTPDEYFAKWTRGEIAPPQDDNDFPRFIFESFDLPKDDDYHYRATAVVTLSQVQRYLQFGAKGGLLAWYRDDEGNEIQPHPPAADIQAYAAIFQPNTSTFKALTSLRSNASKGSIRAVVAAHLQSCHRAHVSLPSPRTKMHTNPYLDLWTWTSLALDWAGPTPTTSKVKTSHALLPILYHHFGCLAPSYEALALIQKTARGRRVLDCGSGTGYWTYMLRRMSNPNVEVLPLDNGLSDWRTMWIGDTVATDCVEFLKQNRGGTSDVLMLVYPNTMDDFTARVIQAYKGTTIVYAGTQDDSGFTGFKRERIVEWMAREMTAWELSCQIPLPSFAGRDEAFFIYEKIKRI